MFLPSWFKKPKVIKDQISLTIEKLATIELKNISSVYMSDMSLYEIDSFYTRIVDYNKLLNKLIEHFQEQKLLYVYQIPQTIQKVYIGDFYLDSNNKYLDPVSTTDDFIQLSLSFLKIYRDTEQQGGRSFQQDKNLLLSQQIIANIITISSQLENLDNIY